MARQSTGVIENLLKSIPIPRMVRVRQRLERPVLQDPGGELVRRLEAGGHLGHIENGMSVAITVGSRGISNLPRIVARIVESVKGRGGEPFLVPAMGSHGGATAEGQKRMLIGMGFEEGAVGAPIRSSMEVVRLGETEVGLPVCVDRTASEADGIILLNRIKAHTSFEGEIESGLLKMIAIGLGKQRGAESCHQLGFGCMERSIRDICRAALPQLEILFAVGLLENAFHETCRIAVLGKDEIEDREPELLAESKRLMGKLHFDTLDVLVVDEIGKDISGTGMDTNVVGRYHTGFGTGGPDITRIAVLDLTERSHGNATGLGISDFTTRRMFEKMEFDQTYPNSLTSTVPVSVKIPMVLDSDRLAIQAAIKTCNILHLEQARMVRIRNTLSLEEIEVSENLAAQLAGSSVHEVLGEPYDLAFDREGNLTG